MFHSKIDFFILPKIYCIECFYVKVFNNFTLEMQWFSM